MMHTHIVPKRNTGTGGQKERKQAMSAAGGAGTQKTAPAQNVGAVFKGFLRELPGPSFSGEGLSRILSGGVCPGRYFCNSARAALAFSAASPAVTFWKAAMA